MQEPRRRRPRNQHPLSPVCEVRGSRGIDGVLLPLPFGLVNLAGWCCYLTPKNFPTHVQKDRIAGAGIGGVVLFLDCEKYFPACVLNGCIAGAGELLLLLVLRDAKPV